MKRSYDGSPSLGGLTTTSIIAYNRTRHEYRLENGE